MKEYKVCYTVNNEGYTKELPWLDYCGDDEEYALEALARVEEEVSRYKTHEAWIEVRDITPWKRLDVAP